MCRFPTVLAVLTTLAACTAAEAQSTEDWPWFLGPDRNGVSAATNVNTHWKSRPPREVWRVPLGKGLSSLCVVGDRVYTQAERGDRQVVAGFDAATGRELWSTPVCKPYLDKQKQGAGPRATPTFDDGRLYCLFPTGDAACVEAATGKIVWRIDLFEAAGAKNPAGETFYWGLSQSPLVDGEQVIFCPGGSRNNSVVALDKSTGRLVWGGGDDPPGYGSPIVFTHSGRRQIVAVGGQSLMAFAAQTGEPLWRLAIGNKYDCNCATPLVVGERLFYSAAYGTGATLVDVTRNGDDWTPRSAWTSKQMQNQMTTSIVLDGYAYGSSGESGSGTFRCVDLTDGEVQWIDRAPGKCQLLAVAGHLIAISEDGTLRLIEANPKEYVEKGRLDDVLGAKSWAVPALARGRLYLRDHKHLACFDLAR